MEPIKISLEETSGIERVYEPVQLGIPVPKGVLTPGQHLKLQKDGENHHITCQHTEVSWWPDGSIKWLILSFQACQAAHSKCIYTVSTGRANSKPGLLMDERELYLDITTRNHKYQINKNQLAWNVYSRDSGKHLHSIECEITDVNENRCKPVITSDWSVLEMGETKIVLSCSGQWRTNESTSLANFRYILTFYSEGEHITSAITIHNPKRAKHTGGLWDLGDEGSILFKSMVVAISHHELSLRYQLSGELDGNTDQPLVSMKPLEIYQDSSGGQNWNSRSHLTSSGEISTSFRGFRIIEESDSIQEGYRASPTIQSINNVCTIQASIKNFWQDFPNSLKATSERLEIGLFPGKSKFPYELQGGEKKTKVCHISLAEDNSSLNWTIAPLTPTIDASLYDKANVFPWCSLSNAPAALDKLIEVGLEGPNNFTAKREAIDEYGWRNFGDIFADHETLYQASDEPRYITHYNNQYDAIFGFMKQFIRTGDARWYELMDSLARHVIDIDIYDTVEDKAEYNGGLFWHTDHYLDAHTATHRTYSRFNDSSSIPGQTGGGPAAEHCYTTGLALHYLISGNEDSKRAVITLSNWMISLHEGQGGVLEALLQCKKSELPQLKALLKKEPVSTHQYPFTRGTGNYINALLDAWLLTGEESWLKLSEKVIRKTIHPKDDIEKRNLLDAENSWSYLVLLASITKYLWLKAEIENFDASYDYAYQSISTYTQWMLQHERPFLDNSEALEYPNDTWTAQDIRKAMIFFQASVLFSEKKRLYSERANYFLNYVVNKLDISKEKHFARILIILMQNYGPQQLQDASSLFSRHHVKDEMYDPPVLDLKTAVSRIFLRLFKGFRSFSIRNEYKWLKTRLNIF